MDAYDTHSLIPFNTADKVGNVRPGVIKIIIEGDEIEILFYHEDWEELRVIPQITDVLTP
nr:hypothetical protein BGP89_06990 [Luteimonas sp. JM171]